MSGLLDFLRNLYGASGGAIPAAAWTATAAALLWMASYDDGPEEGDVKDVVAARIGWTDRQVEEFWNDASTQFTPDGARKFDESYDAWEWMLRTRRKP